MFAAICICTFKRPNGLLRLLTEINKLELFKYPDIRIKVVVIDNDENASAKVICDGINTRMRWPLEYHVEPERGIPSARNSALHYAGSDPDCIIFIDDDEAPETNWLDELLSVQEAYNADAVVGPVISRYESNVPQWVIKGNFYQRKRNKTGDIQQSAATSNVLIKNEIIRKENLSFNKQLGLSGADDECFFREFVHRGHTIIWADKAIVYEYVPSSRIGLRWLMQRSYRGGLYFTFIQLQLHPGNKILFERIVKGMARILIGFVLIIISMVRGYHTFVSGAQSIALGVGTFAGLLGLKYEEYKKIHGT